MLLPWPQVFADGSGWSRASAPVRVEYVDSIPEAGTHQEEAYRLVVSRKSILIEAVTPEGEFRARQTLQQLEHRRGRVKCCRVTDWAAFPWRGFMQDVGRSFLSTEELKRELKAAAQFKINVFHWHLTENQAWRLESKLNPELNSPENMLRFKGLFYSYKDVHEVLSLCDSLHIKVVPEIDMPGHSAAFERTFGCAMQSAEGRAIIKALVAEACELFKGCEYFHIGTDEVGFTDGTFVPEMVDLVRSRGFKAISWNPGWHYEPGEIDATQLWSYRGQAQDGIPAIDSKLHYVNHYDCFSDIRILYSLQPGGYDESDGAVTGAEICLWHDRLIQEEDLMVRENSFYPALMTLAERTWRGGAAGSRVCAAGRGIDGGFVEFEQRMVHHIATTLKGLPVTYVRQAGVKWGISKVFPNGGDLTATFPPETEDPSLYKMAEAEGAGIYLRHVWGDTCPQFLDDPQPNSTVYAWTYVWSPERQNIGLLCEFQNYSRSERDPSPSQGTWDSKGSRAWLNGREILPPRWASARGGDPEEPLGNENLTARPPLHVSLEKGWNYVLLKLPVGAFSTEECRLVKWGFSFVFTTPDGTRAADGLKYSADRASGRLD